MTAATLGICCQELTLLKPADATRVLEDIARFGFKHVRVEIPWQLVEPAKGKWTWGATTYLGQPAAGVQLVVDTARKLGLTLLPVLGVHMPTWQYTAAHFGYFAGRAYEQIQAPTYEVMNEPNLHRFVPWADAKVVVPLIREARANIPDTADIVFPGLAAAATKIKGWALAPGLFGIPWPTQFTNLSPEDFLRDALKAGVHEAFEIMAYHPYSIGPGFDEQPPSAKQVMIAKGEVLAKTVAPLLMWATEWGYPAKLGLKVQADRFTAQLPLIRQQYQRSYLFSWRDYGAFDYGLVDANNKPRQPLFDTVKAVL